MVCNFLPQAVFVYTSIGYYSRVSQNPCFTSMPSFPPFPSHILTNHFLDEVFRETRALLKRLRKALVSTIVRVADNLGSLTPAELAKEHDLGLTVWVAPLEPLQVGEVRSVHGEDVVKGFEILCLELDAPKGAS